jgi:formylglycine-generating enzyme required for sulfatase activity
VSGGAALVLAVAWACNVVTGASSYAEVARCTDPSCAEHCEDSNGEWNESTSECRCVGPYGIRDDAGYVPMCGGICCPLQGENLNLAAASNCLMSDAGEPFCSSCTSMAAICGNVCCNGETCLNPDASACGAPYGTSGQSCAGAGGLRCPVVMPDGGVDDADCCETIAVPGGTFDMGRSASGANACPAEDLASGSCDPSEVPQHVVTLAPYTLDRFEVTVGRFRQFVAQWNYEAPPAGAGGAANLSNAGWQSEWDVYLPTTLAALEGVLDCDEALETWTAVPGANESRPINCMNWYLAFTFCAWDGGRLPTEAEWEFAAGNGIAGDLYPWGESAPSPSLATYYCNGACSFPPGMPAPVGSTPSGANRWGHQDLAGNVSEWTLDVWSPYPSNVDAAAPNYLVSSYGSGQLVRSVRGGSFLTPGGTLRAAARAGLPPTEILEDGGFRCARTQ